MNDNNLGLNWEEINSRIDIYSFGLARIIEDDKTGLLRTCLEFQLKPPLLGINFSFSNVYVSDVEEIDSILKRKRVTIVGIGDEEFLRVLTAENFPFERTQLRQIVINYNRGDCSIKYANDGETEWGNGIYRRTPDNLCQIIR